MNPKILKVSENFSETVTKILLETNNLQYKKSSLPSKLARIQIKMPECVRISKELRNLISRHSLWRRQEPLVVYKAEAKGFLAPILRSDSILSVFQNCQVREQEMEKKRTN